MATTVVVADAIAVELREEFPVRGVGPLPGSFMALCDVVEGHVRVRFGATRCGIDSAPGDGRW